MDLSIIIPMHNSEKYIEECLKSIIIYYSSKLEVIVIDDGSTDKSKQICEKYSKYIKIISIQNHGVSYARNLGISIAKGKYLMFVDADDILQNHWYDNIKKFFQMNYDMIIFSKQYNGEKLEKENLLKGCLGNSTLAFDNMYFMTVWSKLYKRQFFKENKLLFNEKIINGEDMLFNFQILSNTNNIYITNKSFYLYRHNLLSTSQNFNYKLIESNKIFENELEKIIVRNNLSELQCNIIHSRVNGIYLLFFKVMDIILENKRYLENDIIFLNSINLKNVKLKKFRKFIVYLLKEEKIYIAFCLCKIKKSIDLLIKKNMEYFESI